MLPAVATFAMVGMGVAHAAEVTPESEYGRRIKVYQTIQPLGETPFGENVNLYTGDLTFQQTDVAVEGQGPAITLARNSVTRLSDTETVAPDAFGNWKLSIPRIETLVDRSLGWVSESETVAGRRCSQFDRPVFSTMMDKGWHGFELVTESGERQPLIKRGPQNTLAPSAAIEGVSSFPIVTQQKWQIGCLPETPNTAAVNDEAFFAVSPNGTRYWFNYLVYDQANTVYENDGGVIIRQRRDLATMYVTRIEDRFGNAVVYDYGGDDKLDSIKGYVVGPTGDVADGRHVQITWRSDARLVDRITVQPAAPQPRIWRYEYADIATAPRLTGVVLPDNSRWSFDLQGVGGGTMPNTSECYTRTRANGTTSTVLTMTHPSGLVGKFWKSGRWHARSYVPSACVWPSPPAEAEPYEDISPLFGTSSLVQKEISGPGVAPRIWTYEYQTAAGSTTYDACATAGTCATTKWVKVVNPAGDLTTYTFSNRWDTTEGQLLRTDSYQGTTGPLLRSEITTYAPWNQGPWPAGLGTAFDDVRANAGKGLVWMPVKSRQILQQGQQFNWQATAFDNFAKPLTVTRSSNLHADYTRTDTTVYFDSLPLWVLGQVESSTTSGLVESATDYDEATALPVATYAFGKLQQTMRYNPDGTLDTVADGRNTATYNTTIKLTEWERGIPKKITFPDNYFKAAEVDAFGQIEWVEDELGNRTCYRFDIMGRLDRIMYPSETALQTCDESKWNALYRSFAPVASAEYGLPAGHWKESVNTGKGFQVTYFDGLWRPVVVERFDDTDAATKAATLTQTVTRYAPQGGVAFQSYPGIGYTDFATVSSGTRTTYDALGRPTRVEQDSELGPLVTTHEYLTGFSTRTTSPGTTVTQTWYQAYDQPSTDMVRAILHPENTATDIPRDEFGKPKYITRRAADWSKSLTRYYTYNEHQELCRTSEPETGVTLMGYDAAGNLAWSASGLAAGTPCEEDGTSSSVLPRRSTRTYDSRNRLTNLGFADDQGEQVWTYTPDGLPATVWTYNGANRTLGVHNAYSYNSRRMLGGTGESLHEPGWTWSLGYGYDKNGFLTVQVYPDTTSFTATVNALGQTTGITGTSGTYVSGASYFPNGALKQFTYGNGIVHTLAQNARGLADRSKDAYGGVAVLDDSYDYDFNGNVASISDGRAGASPSMSRTMTYDGLDRLTSVTSPMFNGTISYTYDVFDNIETLKAPANNLYPTPIPARDLRYCYKTATNQLQFLRSGATDCNSGQATTAFDFDDQGNIESKNAWGYKFTFDNRLRDVSVSGVVKETYRYDANGRRVTAEGLGLGKIRSYYNKGGQLSFQADGRTGKNLAYVYLSGSLVATREQPTAGGAAVLKFHHTDALGSPVAVTNASRTILETSKYEPYGSVINRALRDGHGFTGHIEDAQSGLNYMQQRYYDSGIGLFLSVDPVSVDSDSGTGFNRYAYAVNNPYGYVDPDGQKEKKNGEDAEESCDIECKRQKQRDRDGIANAAFGVMSSFAASHPLPQSVVDAGNGLGAGIIDGASFGFADGDHFFDQGDSSSYSSFRDGGRLVGGAATGGATWKAGGSLLSRFAGPAKQWFRFGPSYSSALGQRTQLSFRWGASPAKKGRYLNEIPSTSFRTFNQWLRSLKLPGSNWRVTDPGHLHLRK